MKLIKAASECKKQTKSIITTLLTIRQTFLIERLTCLHNENSAFLHSTINKLVVSVLYVSVIRSRKKIILTPVLSVEVISRLLWFCFSALCDWLAKFAPFSQPIGEPNQNQLCFRRTAFPALYAGYMHLLRILIGSLSC